jgi:hypothetical protein
LGTLQTTRHIWGCILKQRHNDWLLCNMKQWWNR